jgi:hypothetical protein
MTTLLQLKELRHFVEDYLKNKKEEIISHNNYYQEGFSFLYRTYCVEWPYERGNPKIRITVFRDLPSPYPELISSQIRIYMRKNGFDAEYRYWNSYKAFKALDPVRTLRN